MSDQASNGSGVKQVGVIDQATENSLRTVVYYEMQIQLGAAVIYVVHRHVPPGNRG